MPVSRNSFRRVIGDMVHRHSIKTEPKPVYLRNDSNRLNKKIDRNSMISNDSLSVCYHSYYKTMTFFLFPF